MRKNMLELIIAILCIIIFLILLYLVLTKKIAWLDQNTYEKIAKLISPTNTKIIKSLTFLGSTLGIIISIAISYFFITNNFDRGFLTFGILGEVLLNNLLKILVGRYRPTINPLVIEKGHSFPSGHTMVATAFYLFLIYFLWKSPLTILWKTIITILFIGIILIVMFTRVYLGVHYFSDVLAGFACSAAYVLILTILYPYLKEIIL